ncbi:MAG: PQQ-binding-like beta-propeller repeat protein [Armatimonadetes bacterium]|nr:PQQ-binding-like beta-propeller repeat protein [Armatimonadota bacterium]
MDYRIRWQQQRRQRRRKRLLIIPAALALTAGLYLLLRDAGGSAPYWMYQSPDRLTPHFTVAHGLVYVVWPNGHVQVLRTTTGRPTGAAPFFSVPEAFNTAPTVAQRALYLGSDSGVIRALDARTGHPLWDRNTGAPIRCQPVYAGGRVFVGNGAGKVYCFSPEGQKVWARQLDDGISGRLALVSQLLIVSTTRGAVHALDPTTGKPVWRQDLQSPDLPTPVFAPVTAAPPLALVGSDNGYLYLLKAASGQPVGEPYYTRGLVRQPAAVDERVIAFGSTDGWLRVISRDGSRPLWAYRLSGPIAAGPVIARGVIYAASPNRLVALDAVTGRVRRSWKGEQFAGDLVVWFDTIYLGTNQGSLWALPAP